MRTPSVAFFLIIPFITSGCESEWSKRKYCAQLGRSYEKNFDEENKKASQEFDSRTLMVSGSINWTYCKVVDSCLADVHKTTFVVSDEKTKIISDNVFILDLMTNKSLIYKFKANEDFKSKDMEDFESETNKMLPTCFDNN